LEATYRVSRWTIGLFSWSKLILPDRINIYKDKIEIIKYRFFGLNSTQEEIKYKRIASVRKKDGMFFSDLIIETSGGAKDDIKISGLPKKQAKEASNLIQDKIE